MPLSVDGRSVTEESSGSSRSRTVGGNSIVGNIGYIPVVSISHVVVYVLDPAVGEGHPVGA